MEQKINVAKLLKDCPSGMELDCVMYDNLYFDSLNADYDGTISCYTLIDGIKSSIDFSKYGTFNNHKGAKCVIFPKGETTWEGFVSPCKFKDGDIIFTGTDRTRIGLGNTWISIFEENRNGGVATYVDYCNEGKYFYSYLNDKGLLCLKEDIIQQRLATEEEKQRLFQAIKDNGYKWNPETKTLKKLVKPRFKVGDRVKSIYNNNQYDIVGLTDTHYTLVEVENKFKYTEPIIEDKNLELVPNKFDITTLKPFESKVLVRTDNRKWVAAFYSHYDKDASLHYCVVGGLWYEQCIPYEGNEHLLGTTNDCDGYYKTWGN